jgi:hypothetical protein
LAGVAAALCGEEACSEDAPHACNKSDAANNRPHASAGLIFFFIVM